MSPVIRLGGSVVAAVGLFITGRVALLTDGERLCECGMHTTPVGPEGDILLLWGLGIGIVVLLFAARHAWREMTWLERVERQAGSPTPF